MASSIPEDVNIQRQLTDAHIKEWLAEDVFQLKWWLLILLIISIIIVWLVMLDKSRLQEILLFTALTAVIFMGINEYGEELVLWDYPIDIIPIFPPLSSINLISLPLIYSQIYQRFSRRQFIYAVLITTAVICFAIEPILSLVGFYQLIHWKHFLNYPVYVIAILFTKGFTNIIIRITMRKKVKC
jgi:signal transduction histidine kinase